MSAIGFESHDHAACIRTALDRADAHCAARKLQFTDIRRRVLEILLRDHRAMGAYDILRHLEAEGRRAQPPVAYRALDFLVTHGFAHKVEKLNAYIACGFPGENHHPAFMICRLCDAVVEARSNRGRGSLGGAADAAGFVIENTVIEAEGVCPACQDQSA